LDRIEDALDCGVHCLRFDPGNMGVQTVRDRATKAKADKDKKERERLERIRKEQDAKRLLNSAFRVREVASGLSIRPLIY